MAAAAVPLLKVAATAVTAYGNYRQGRDASDAASFEAGQLRANAERTAEAGLKRAQEVRRQKLVALSDARAVQASQGGSTTDAGALAQQGSLASAFERNALEELYQSGLDQQALLTQASVRKLEGRAAKRAGTIGAITTVLGNVDSIYEAGSSFKKLLSRPKIGGFSLGRTDGVSETKYSRMS